METPTIYAHTCDENDISIDHDDELILEENIAVEDNNKTNCVNTNTSDFLSCYEQDQSVSSWTFYECLIDYNMNAKRAATNIMYSLFKGFYPIIKTSSYCDQSMSNIVKIICYIHKFMGEHNTNVAVEIDFSMFGYFFEYVTMTCKLTNYPRINPETQNEILVSKKSDPIKVGIYMFHTLNQNHNKTHNNICLSACGNFAVNIALRSIYVLKSRVWNDFGILFTPEFTTSKNGTTAIMFYVRAVYYE